MEKVVIIGSAYPLRGGLASYNERLARAFMDKGYEVEIFTFSLQYPSIFFPGKTQYSSEPPPKDLKIRKLVNSVNPFNWIYIGNRIRKLKPDLVIIKYWLPFMGPCLGTLARRIRRNNHSTIISIADNIIPHEKRPGDKSFTNYFINSVDGFVTMSKSVTDDLLSFDPEKPNLFSPHPLYDNFGEKVPKTKARGLLKLGEEERIILFFGIIRDYKGLDLLLKAMSDKDIKSKGIKLIVAGEFYTDPEPYYEIIKNYSLDDAILMHDRFIPDSEVLQYFCASDLVVQPYKSATQSGVTQIAYHFDIPIITTDVGGLAEIVPDQKVGYVIDPEPGEISSAINRFYDQDMEQEFIDNLRIEKKKYTWEKMVGNIIRLKELISKKKANGPD